MKTIDLLVRALPEIGGWPEKVTHIGQDYDRELMFYGRGKLRTGIILEELAIDHRKNGEAGVKITREQYESALAAKNDGWIEWGGGKCPLHNGAIVDVKLRNGRTEYAQKALSTEGYASYPFWRNDGAGGDIIAYRLRQPTKSEQVRADSWAAYAGIEEVNDEADLNECIGQSPAPLWNGEGLPPVGCECEMQNDRGEWIAVDIIAQNDGFSFGWNYDYRVVYFSDEPAEFRPIPSEAERKRYAAVDAFNGLSPIELSGELAYDAIAAGKIPGVKLED